MVDQEPLKQIYKNVYSCSWQKSIDYVDLSEYEIACILTLSTNKKPDVILNYYTEAKIYSYTFAIDNNDPIPGLKNHSKNIVDAIRFCLSRGHNILIHTNGEDRLITFVMLLYLLTLTYEKKHHTEIQYISLLHSLSKSGLPVDIERNSALIPLVAEFENALRASSEKNETLPDVPKLG